MSIDRPQLWRRMAMTAIAVSCLPLLSFPWLLSLSPDTTEAKTLLYLYPFYVLLTAWCARACYGGERTVLTWILVALLWLSHGAMWLLVDPSILLL